MRFRTDGRSMPAPTCNLWDGNPSVWLKATGGARIISKGARKDSIKTLDFEGQGKGTCNEHAIHTDDKGACLETCQTKREVSTHAWKRDPGFNLKIERDGGINQILYYLWPQHRIRAWHWQWFARRMVWSLCAGLSQAVENQKDWVFSSKHFSKKNKKMKMYESRRICMHVSSLNDVIYLLAAWAGTVHDDRSRV